MSIIVGHAVEVLAMHHHVQRERQAGGPHGGGEASSCGMRAGQAGDAVAFSGCEVLEAQLDMVEPGGGEGLDLARAAQRAGGDEVAVEAEPVAAPISARRSRRAIGSPPEKCTCSTPSAAASPSTRRQSCS